MRALRLLLMAGGLAAAQTHPQGGLKVRFENGPVLDIRTESTRGTPTRSTSGSESVPKDYDFHRLVFDGPGNVLFGYDIEARSAGTGVVKLRIKPVDTGKFFVGGYGRRAAIPTLTGVREFPPLRAGDAVEVDILSKPATGERIYDVLKIALADAPDAPARPAGERLSLEDAQIGVNGKMVAERQESRHTWMRCGALMIHLPGRGEFYFSLTPPAGLPFRPAAWVDRTTLRFHAGPDLVEITGRSNILPRSLFATLWMHHIPSTPDRGYEFHCGDDAQSVIELYRKKDD